MHRAAQHGVAMYWLERAARGKRLDSAAPLRPDDLPEWVRQLSTWHTELNFSASEFVAALRGDLFEEQTYVFTPKGEIQELPAGSTVLDLAYQIHTKIGDHAIGAEVQTTATQGSLVTRHVPVEYLLSKGDIVRVLTDPKAEPKPEWRDIARTRYARGKIARSLRVQARGDRDHSVRREEDDDQDAPYQVVALRHPNGEQARAHLAQCCDPCPGDAIAGLIMSGRDVTIHRACCATLRHALATRRQRGQAYAEPLRVGWPEIHPERYRVHLVYVGQDHQGLMHELSICASQLNLNVAESRAVAQRDRHKAAVSLTLDVPSETRLDAVVRRFLTAPGSVSVTRDTTKGCGKSHDDI
jgi:(p)ppGpp synthase/HD superfamily hydrolase